MRFRLEAAIFLNSYIRAIGFFEAMQATRGSFFPPLSAMYAAQAIFGQRANNEWRADFCGVEGTQSVLRLAGRLRAFGSE
jgi:hypothetical protein